jgi:translation initiation factor IF-2
MVINTTSYGPAPQPASDQGVVIGTDRALTQVGNWAAVSPQQLYDAVNVNTDPAQCYASAYQWSRLGSAMAEQSSLLANQVQGSAAGWQGSAADAARAALGRLATWSQQTSNAVGTVGQRMHTQTDIVATAQANMPQPVKMDMHHVLDVASLAGLAAANQDLKQQVDHANATHTLAAAVMTTMETSSKAIDANVPTFVPPPATVRSATAAQGPASTPRTIMQPLGQSTGTSPSGVSSPRHVLSPLGSTPGGPGGPGGPGAGAPGAVPLLPAASANGGNPPVHPYNLTAPAGAGGAAGGSQSMAGPHGTTPQWAGMPQSQGGGSYGGGGGSSSGQQPNWSMPGGAGAQTSMPYNTTTSSAGVPTTGPMSGAGNLPSMPNPYGQTQSPGGQLSPNWTGGGGPGGAIPPGGIPGFPGSSGSLPQDRSGKPGSAAAGANAMFGAGGVGMGGAGMGGAGGANLGGAAGAGGATPGQGAISGAMPGKGGPAGMAGGPAIGGAAAAGANAGSNSMMGGGGAGAGAKRGQDDAEHTNKYAGENDGLFAVPEADRLPPSVIGEKRPNKPQNETPGT